MKITEQHTSSDEVSYGNLYVMTHSFFSDVVRIVCTPSDLIEYAIALSAKTLGDYTVVFSQQCQNPCKVKKKFNNI
jgi:hypothetical protein